MYSAIWAYPWDFLDEGPEAADRIADAGLEGVSVAAAYHTVRTLCPHNPVRAVYHGEGGVLYFHPEQSRTEPCRIKPVLSELCEHLDPLHTVCEMARRRGLKVHAWTVLTHNTRLGTRFPDCTIENAFGDRYLFGLCPAHPDVRAYAIAVMGSLASRSEVSTIELESVGYMGIDHSGHHSKTGIVLDDLHRFLLSICFCPHCRERMQAQNVDAGAAREAVVQEMRGYFAGRYRNGGEDALSGVSEVLGEDTADGILQARDEVVLTLMEELYWLVNEPQVLSVMVSPTPTTTGALAGVTLSQARQWCDRLLTQAFHKEPDGIRKQVADVAVRRGSTPVHAGLQAIVPYVGSEEHLASAARAAVDAGAEGLEFYHYGLAPLENLNWIRSVLAAV